MEDQPKAEAFVEEPKFEEPAEDLKISHYEEKIVEEEPVLVEKEEEKQPEEDLKKSELSQDEKDKLDYLDMLEKSGI